MWAASWAQRVFCGFGSSWSAFKVSAAPATQSSSQQSQLVVSFVHLGNCPWSDSRDGIRYRSQGRCRSELSKWSDGAPLLNPGRPLDGGRQLVKTAVDKCRRETLSGRRGGGQNAKRPGRRRIGRGGTRGPVGNLALDTRYGNTDCRCTTCVASRERPWARCISCSLPDAIR